MNENTEEARSYQFMTIFPDMFDKPGKLLYVGGHLRYGRDLQMTRLFRNANWQIDVIEIFEENINQLRGLHWITNLIHGDIRTYDPEKYDVIMFWHGPEHLLFDEVVELTDKLKKHTDLLIYATPNGRYDQGEEYGNPYEVHASTWTKEKFEWIGMKADAIGNPDQKQGNIIAWTSV